MTHALRRFLLPVSFVMTGGLSVFGSNGASSASESPLTFPSGFDEASLEQHLEQGHPRLFAREDRWRELRESIPNTPELQNAFAALEEAASEILEAPPQERVMTGRRLLSVSREVLRRTLVLGTLFQVTGDDRYFDRARAELLAAAAFEDWNPSHFLDVAEMTLGVAVGYDWLHDRLSEEDRATLKEAIVEKGLRPGTGNLWWKRTGNNWNQVCFAGMVAGALAIGDEEPTLAVTFLREMFENIHRPLNAYRPHGAYPEGPGYWNYGTHFQVILLSVLESALGKTWNLENYPAFQESAVYVNLVAGPTGQFFNYGDGAAPVPRMAALHWFAARARDPGLDAREREQLREGSADLASRAKRDRFFALSLLWFEPALKEEEARALPLHWQADGPNPVAVHRSSWEKDGWFLAIKGGSPGVSHGHMDIGSFVFDWSGQRWAVDLGAQSYHALESIGMDLWNRAQESDRWRVFRLNTLSHNTLVVDGEQQRVDGFAPVAAFSADPEAPFTVVDMTPVYRDSLTRAVRGARLLKEEALLVHDTVEGLASGRRVRWGMLTRAEVELDGSRALLRRRGSTLHARILSPATAVFEVVRTNPPPNEFDIANPGTRMLALFVEGNDEPRQIRVVFSGEPLSESRIEEILSLPSPEEWSRD